MDTHPGRRRLLLVLAVVGACPLLSAGPARAGSAAVDEVGRAFEPAQVDIVVGDRVVWTNRSELTHSVAFENGPDLHPTCAPGLLPGSRVGDCQEPGASAQYTFAAPGNFAYRCKLHDSMRGVVVVSKVATTTSTTAAPTTTTTRATTTTTRATSSTTSTTRPLATSSTLASSTTTATTDPGSSVLLPGDPPPFAGEDSSSNAADDGGDKAIVALIVALLLAASAGGGYFLWRIRPGRT